MPGLEFAVAAGHLADPLNEGFQCPPVVHDCAWRVVRQNSEQLIYKWGKGRHTEALGWTIDERLSKVG